MNQRYNKKLLVLFWMITISRFFSMFFIPLTDTTEARYANIALIMAKTGNWITPYFDYGVPFWGKPPLSFWFQAFFYKLFGVYDFVPRIPSLIVTLGTSWLIYKFLTIVSNKTSALLAIVIYSSTLLVYVLSGAVLTDPYLTFGTTLSLLSFLMVIKGEQRYWGYLFFIGLSIGLLSKGPLALVITGGIIILWILLSFKKRISALGRLPWITGGLLMLLLSVPWYIIAEMKSPGFLRYFIIGEHFDRFLDPGWKGDLYGSAHKHIHGTIWLMWLYASLPWGIISLIIALKHIGNRFKRFALLRELKKDDLSFYTVWMLFSMLFFTVSGNVLWTYILPSIPALSIISALYINRENGKFINSYKRLLYINTSIVPVIGIIATMYIIIYPVAIPTEKFLIARYKSVLKGNEPIYFVEQKSFSSTYYMNKKLNVISLNKLRAIEKNKDSNYFFVIKKNLASQMKKIKHFKLLYSSKKYQLYLSKIRN